jgi:uncharacterized membrane protein
MTQTPSTQAFIRPPSLAERLLALVIPLGITAGLLGAGLIWAFAETQWLLGHVVLSFFLAGKFIVLGASVPDNPFSCWELALLITYMDTLTGIILVYNMDVLFRIPRLGPVLWGLRAKARQALVANAWLRKLSYLGVIIFVTFPISGTGAIGGSFLGKFMGLHRLPHLLAIGMGGAVGGFSMATLAASVGEENARVLVQENPYLTGVALLLLILVLAWLGRLFFRSGRFR